MEPKAPTNSDAATFLIRCCEAGDLHKVQALVEAGVSVNAKNKFGDSALQCATRCGHVEVVDFLCEREADVHVRGMRARTALEWAAFLGQVALEEVGSNDLDARTAADFTPLHWAATLGHIQVGLVLMEHGADLNLAGSEGAGGRTPLHCATEHRQLDFMVMLIQSGAEVDRRDEWGRTPLHYAVGKNFPDASEILIKSKADVNAVAKVGVERFSRPFVSLTDYTPLHLAAVLDSKTIAQLLTMHGANPTAKNSSGFTPLQLANKYRATSVAPFLHHIAPPKPPKAAAPPPPLSSHLTAAKPVIAGPAALAKARKHNKEGGERSKSRERSKSARRRSRSKSSGPSRREPHPPAPRVSSVSSTAAPPPAASTRTANMVQLEARASEESRRLWQSASFAISAFIDEVFQANVRQLRDHHQKVYMAASDSEKAAMEDASRGGRSSSLSHRHPAPQPQQNHHHRHQHHPAQRPPPVPTHQDANRPPPRRRDGWVPPSSSSREGSRHGTPERFRPEQEDEEEDEEEDIVPHHRQSPERGPPRRQHGAPRESGGWRESDSSAQVVDSSEYTSAKAMWNKRSSNASMVSEGSGYSVMYASVEEDGIGAGSVVGIEGAGPTPQAQGQPSDMRSAGDYGLTYSATSVGGDSNPLQGSPLEKPNSNGTTSRPRSAKEIDDILNSIPDTPLDFSSISLQSHSIPTVSPPPKSVGVVANPSATPGTNASKAPQEAAQNAPTSLETWDCHLCRTENVGNSTHCKACTRPRRK